MSDHRPSQFYTGLIADLYESLASEHAQADDYIPFIERSGTPALELACGSGVPLLELVERGYDVEGLDASRDMLDRCRAHAAERGLDVALYLGEMQSFALSGRYPSIFLAGASFTLLTTDEDASSALRQIHDHLEPGGSAMIPLEIPDEEEIRRSREHIRDVTTAAGDRLRLATIAIDPGADGRSLCRRLRFERNPAGDEPQILERDWKTRWWPQDLFREMLMAAGFGEVAFETQSGGPARSGDSAFVALARRGGG